MTKLADLGIATASDGTKITRSGTVLGTARVHGTGYSRRPRGRAAGDVYALAAITFEALSGKRPREGRSPIEIAHKIATEGTPDLRDVWPTAPNEAARAPCSAAWPSSRSDRPESAETCELGRALEDPPGETRRRAASSEDLQAAAAALAAAQASQPAPRKAAARPWQPRRTSHRRPGTQRPPPRAAAASRPQAAPPSASPPRRTWPLCQPRRWQAPAAPAPSRSPPSLSCSPWPTIAAPFSRVETTAARRRRAPTTRRRKTEGRREQEEEGPSRQGGTEGARRRGARPSRGPGRLRVVRRGPRRRAERPGLQPHEVRRLRGRHPGRGGRRLVPAWHGKRQLRLRA